MANERSRTERRISIPRSVRGYSLEGPGFYVWDEDAREVKLAGEMFRRTLASRPGEPEPEPEPDASV